MSALKYWVWLSSIGVAPAKAKELLSHLGSVENIYYAGRADYLDIAGIKPADVEKLMCKDFEKTNAILASCDELGCRVLALQDSEYPDRLRNIYDSPLVLYLRGKLPLVDDEPVVGVVGTRKCTPYGITVAENVSYGMSKSGIIVSTGLARGVDTAAIRGALRGGSSVIGVIGAGVDVVYPPENKSIYDDVASAGAIISEYPPGTQPLPHHFPARNRIISGVSLGVAVIEAPKRSGALITASRALEQGRDVFSLPGNVDAAACAGSNALLREGAIAFMSEKDIIDEYIDLYPDKITLPDKIETKNSFDNTSKVDYIDLGNLLEKLDGDERSIVESIGLKSLHCEEIMCDTGFPAQKVLACLTMLELGGYVLRDKLGKWEITSELYGG